MKLQADVAALPTYTASGRYGLEDKTCKYKKEDTQTMEKHAHQYGYMSPAYPGNVAIPG